MPDNITKMLSQVCPNICKECRPQCKKWQEISNLEGHELMKLIKTQQEISGNETGSPPRRTDFTNTGVTSSAEPSPQKRQEYLDAKMTSSCVTCHTILQQISILLDDIWDILEPQRKVCKVCQLAKYGECNCQKIGIHSSQKYSPRFNMPSTKEGFLSWLTKLRRVLLKVLEGVSKSRYKIYKGDSKDELERLLQELRLPLQKQARDIRITSLTKFPLSSTEGDESLVASLIENTDLLERVLAKIKAEGSKIEKKLFEDQRLQPRSKISRFPELKVISAQPHPSSKTSLTSDYGQFPPIASKTKSEREELQSCLSLMKDNKKEQYKRDALRKTGQTKSPLEQKNIVPKGSSDNTSARKQDDSAHIQRKLPSSDYKHTEKESRTLSPVTQDKHHINAAEKAKSSLSPTKRTEKESRIRSAVILDKRNLYTPKKATDSKHTEKESRTLVTQDKRHINATEKTKSSLSPTKRTEKESRTRSAVTLAKRRLYTTEKSTDSKQTEKQSRTLVTQDKWHINAAVKTKSSVSPTKRTEKESRTRSAVTLDKRHLYTAEKSKSSVSPTEKSKRESLEHSFPGTLTERKTKGIKETAKMKNASKITDPSINESKKTKTRASEQNLDINFRESRQKIPEHYRDDKLQSKVRTKDEEDKKSPHRKLPGLEKATKLRERSDKIEPLRGDKSGEKAKGKKFIETKSKMEENSVKYIERRPKKSREDAPKGEEDIESPKSKTTILVKTSTQEKTDKDLVLTFQKQGKEIKSGNILGKVKIKEGGVTKSTAEWTSIGKSEDIREVNTNKMKDKQALSKEKPAPLSQDKEMYTKRHTIQVPSKFILKQMLQLKVEELRKQKRLEQTKKKDMRLKKLKSPKSLPNLEKIRQRHRRQELALKQLSESDISECVATPEPFEMIRGNRVIPFEPVPKQDYNHVDHEPLLFKVQANLTDDATLAKGKTRSESAITLGSQMSWAGKGIIEYKLSNPKYIELGYTKLPTVTVMRKSIIYKMEQSHPEEDWFRRHKRSSMLFYDTCEKLAEIDEDGHGRWYYKNGRMALNYCAAESVGKDVRNRYIVYSSGEEDTRGSPGCDTILASFDHLGNGIVYDHYGNVRLKYNQNEGEIFDKTICPLGRWKWHSLNTKFSALENVYVEKPVKLFSKFEMDMFENIANQNSKLLEKSVESFETEDEEQKKMHTVEMRNLFEEKKQMLLQKYQPYQLKMKVLKLNEQFSLRIYEQSKIYLFFNTGTRTLKLNLGLILLPTEILGTERVHLREINTPFDQIIPQSDSVANIRDIVRKTRKKMKKINRYHHRFYSGIKNTSSPPGTIR